MQAGRIEACMSKPSRSESLLIDIMREDIVREDHPQPKPRIQRVPLMLRRVKTNETYFDPKLVSLGPYHRPKPMDCHKKEAAKWFMSLTPGPNSNNKVMKIYKNFVILASRDFPLKDWYADDETVRQLKDEDIAYMMFLDGCFILYLIHLVVKRPTDYVKYPHLYQPFLVSDLFLLENQIPYVVLKSLISLMPPDNTLTEKDIEKFIERWVNLPGHESFDTSSSTPFHLLDILRIKLIGGPIPKFTTFRDNPDIYYFRSIMELKAAGIKFCKNHTRNMSKIKFTEGCIFGSLSLPQMIIDDTTKTRMLNLIAYEMCPDYLSNPDLVCVITSYICFLDTLIDHAADVKELRSKDILLNRLGSDEEVAKLFNEVAINLMPDPRIYADTLSAIQSHCKAQHFKGKLKVRFAEMLHAHFSSPWTAISLVAAILLLVFTAVQTIYNVKK